MKWYLVDIRTTHTEIDMLLCGDCMSEVDENSPILWYTEIDDVKSWEKCGHCRRKRATLDKPLDWVDVLAKEGC